ncbi:MAG: S15 family X-Pro dipeptidyl-peptidase, partial [Cyanobacteriota bacterium]|nr:S15 family X-Pro dipeptidyl-peptidase [Cyanobacteriota bacterium]
SLQATCIKVAKGNALRLSLSADCFPAYAANGGTGKPAGETRLMEGEIITITVSSGGNFSSAIKLSLA